MVLVVGQAHDTHSQGAKRCYVHSESQAPSLEPESLASVAAILSRPATGAATVLKMNTKAGRRAPAPWLPTNTCPRSGVGWVDWLLVTHRSVTFTSEHCPSPLPPFCFSARPPSHQGGVSCEAPRRYRTPHGVLCVRMFVTFGGGKEVVAALAAELQRRVSPCNGLQ